MLCYKLTFILLHFPLCSGKLTKSLDKSNNFTIPTLHEIMFLRNNRSTYKWFLDYIIPAVVGKKYFNDLIYDKYVSEIITVSDEAFGLLCFSNYYESILLNLTSPNKTKQTKPLYTKSGSISVKGNSNIVFKHCGWTFEGLKLYNTLFKKVEQDRLKNNMFDEIYKQHKIVTRNTEASISMVQNKELQDEISNFNIETSWNEAV